jgi:hypothetical protein
VSGAGTVKEGARERDRQRERRGGGGGGGERDLSGSHASNSSQLFNVREHRSVGLQLSGLH